MRPYNNAIQPPVPISGITPAPQGWRLESDFEASRYERETPSFASKGVIKTSDGRTLDFSVRLNMSREFASRSSISIRAGDAAKIDPLIINLDGNFVVMNSRSMLLII